MRPQSSPPQVSPAPARLPAPRRRDHAEEACERLARDEVNVVSWSRALPARLATDLAEWARRCPARFDEVVELPRYDLSRATDGLRAPTRSWLASDLDALIARFADLARAQRVRVSFGAVRTDKCRKFHVDYLRYRLVSTYLGPGTEWVPDEAVDRAALEHPADCPCDANAEIVRDLAAVRHARAGDVLLMKGAKHPSRRGVVHRSPPIEETGRVRVVLIASTVEGA